MLLSLARARRVLFVGGKGGVGKTTVAAAAAARVAAEGRRVLLVSTDPAHNLGHLFERAIGPRATRVAPDLDALELDPDATVEDHLAEVGAALRRYMPERLAGEVDRYLSLARDAPGMQEAALLERVAEVVEEGRRGRDLVVFDTAPSGQTARLMALPELMTAWTEGLLARHEASGRFATALRNLGEDDPVGERLLGDEDRRSPRGRDAELRRLLGRRRARFAGLRAALVDPAHTAFVVALAAERLPVLETVELVERLGRTGLRVAGLVVNRRAPPDAGRFLEVRRALEARHLATLAAALPALPREELPLLEQDVVGLEALRAFAGHLAPPAPE